MSDNKTPGVFKNRVNPLIPHVKNSAIVSGWIAGLLLIAALSWYFTQPIRAVFLQRAVNRVLEQSGDSHRLGNPLFAGSSGALGSWFLARETGGNASAPEGTKVFVFAFMGGGFFFPCAAIVTPGGRVEEFIPLCSYGERMMKRVSPGILRIYTRRIEGVHS